ncbi:MAG: peptide MFS transporter [Bacteroidetes bacterium]|nr:peptide MFS transporter [Bacteroidota bacterium]MBU1719184.1 peptide MFS transporter [Bacteroidota bacterium]
MFKGHPRGLIAASLANMGERFGFYTMMAILSLFLMSKFGLDETGSGWIYSTFYFSIYGMAFFGGLIADKTRNYKGTILTGLVLMSLGYLILSIPINVNESNRTILIVLTCFALFTISFGNGMFKGNLQALVGQMYDNPKYQSKRDSGFSLFYMFINVGAIFAPFIAPAIRNWWLSRSGFSYDANLPALCHQYIAKGTAMGEQALESFQSLVSTVSSTGMPADLSAFSTKYLDTFNTGFHYSFAIAIIAMLISMSIYIFNKKGFPDPADKRVASGEGPVVEMPLAEVKQRIYALLAVFGVVIFFWFSFHQNGLTLTFFAKDYTLLKIAGYEITAEMFQSVNPFFVVFLTPVVMAFFGWLRAKGKEPSTPGKIAIGMGIAAFAYILMTVVSFGLPDLSDVRTAGGLSDAQKVTPFLLIGTYLILTIAELFISPLGISFVSKVAPPKLQGVMQGMWLLATGIGNQLLIIGAIFYKSIPIWATWSIFVVACGLSMLTMILMLKWLERVSRQ